MSLGQQAALGTQNILKPLQGIPERRQQAQQSREVIQGNQENRARQKRAEAFKNIGQASALFKNSKREEINNNPERASEIAQEFIQSNKFAAEAMTNLGMDPDDFGAFLTSKGDVGLSFSQRISEENIDKISKAISNKTGKKVSRNDLAIGDIFTTDSGDDKVTLSVAAPKSSGKGGVDIQGEVSKAVIRAQGLGAKSFKDVKDVDVSLLPDSAILTIGSGEGQVKMLKKPKNLTAAESTIKSTLTKSMAGVGEVLDSLEKGDLKGTDLRIGSKTGALSSKIQKSRTQVNTLVQVLSTAFSGAAIPETEVKRFRQIFGVNATDTNATIKFKLSRSRDLANLIIQNMRYGDPLKTGERENDFSAQLDQVEQELSSATDGDASSNQTNFKNEDEIKQAFDAGTIKLGDTININGKQMMLK